jgi:PhoPQ-activated pathogenicity-related protein
VEQTGDTFYQRMLLNFSMIRTRKHDNVAEHFFIENHSVNDFMVIGIEKRVWRGHSCTSAQDINQ